MTDLNKVDAIARLITALDNCQKANVHPTLIDNLVADFIHDLSYRKLVETNYDELSKSWLGKQKIKI